MILLNSKKRLLFLTVQLPKALMIEENKKIFCYMILDSATRNNLLEKLFFNTEETYGVFPKSISTLVAEHEEPQLVLLNEKTSELFDTAIEEDVNSIQIVYSSLSIKELATQLALQLVVLVEENQEEAFLRYWDSRVFIPFSECINTLERMKAFMGNIYAVCCLDEGMMNQFILFYINTEEEIKKVIIDESEYNEEVNILDNTLLEYQKFDTLMKFTKNDHSILLNYKLSKQINQLSELLFLELNNRYQDVKHNNIRTFVNKNLKIAYQDYSLTSTKSIYIFLLATYILGKGFEKNTSLKNILSDSDESNTIKSLKMKQFLNKKLKNKVEKK